MATFVKGSAAVPNATGYALCKVDGQTYTEIARKRVGILDVGIANEKFDVYGKPTSTDTDVARTAMIDIEDFDISDDVNKCVYLNPTMGANRVMFLYSKYEDYSSYVEGYSYNDLNTHSGGKFDAASIVRLAKENNATHVAFFSITTASPLEVVLPNKINFRLDDYANKLPAGQTHQLVVKAIGEGGEDLDGDGKIYADSDYGGDVNGDPLEYTVEQEAVFNFDFTTNTIDDYALEDIFTVPSGTNTSTIEYDPTYGMSLNGQLANGLNLNTPIDSSKAWALEFTALFVTPTVIAGNRRAFLGGVDLYPFVFINGTEVNKMGFQVSNGSHATIGYGNLIYDVETNYKVVYDGAGKCTIYANGNEIGSANISMTGNFTVILGNVPGKSTAYVWQNVENGKKSYLHKMKFYYN